MKLFPKKKNATNYLKNQSNLKTSKILVGWEREMFDYVSIILLGFAVFAMLFGLIVLYITLRPQRTFRQSKLKIETKSVSAKPVVMASTETTDTPKQTVKSEVVVAAKSTESEEIEKAFGPEQKSAVYCRSCGQESDSDAVFCDNCGASIFEVYCNECGTKNKKTAKYCKKCGKKIE